MPPFLVSTWRTRWRYRRVWKSILVRGRRRSVSEIGRSIASWCTRRNAKFKRHGFSHRPERAAHCARWLWLGISAPDQRYDRDSGYLAQTMTCAVNQLKYQTLVAGKARQAMADPIAQLAHLPAVGRRRHSLSHVISIDRSGATSVQRREQRQMERRITVTEAYTASINHCISLPKPSSSQFRHGSRADIRHLAHMPVSRPR